MLDNEFSLESLVSEGMGFESKKSYESINNTDHFDGNYDSLWTDMQSAENALDFAETYSAMEAKNASEKIKMVRKLKANYGGSSNPGAASIESFCNIMSMEAEESAANAGAEVENKEAPNDEKAKKQSGKIAKFFKSILDGIIWFFKKIWEIISYLPKKLIAFIKNKKKANEKTDNSTNVVDLDETSKSSNTTTNNGTALMDKYKDTLLLDFKSGFNTSGMHNFVKTYNEYAKAFQLFDIDFKNYMNARARMYRVDANKDINSNEFSSQAEKDSLKTFNSDIINKLVKPAKQLPELAGLKVKNFGDVRTGTMKTGEAKKIFDSIRNGLNFNASKRDEALSVIQKLTGLKSISDLELKDRNKFRDNCRLAGQVGEKWCSELDKIVKEMSGSHNYLVQLAEEYQKKLPDFTNVKNPKYTINYTQRMYGILVSALKIATKTEEVVAKVGQTISGVVTKMTAEGFDYKGSNIKNYNKK